MEASVFIKLQGKCSSDQVDAPETQPENENKADEKKNSRGRKLAERIAQLDQPPESLDFTKSDIDCEYKVHSSVICSRSWFFERAVRGRFAEATAKRAHLLEEDADSLELLISILYGFESTYSAELWPEGYEDIRGLLDGIDQTNHYTLPTEPSTTIDIEGSSDIPQENTGLRLLRLYSLLDRPCVIEVIQAVYRCETGNYTELVHRIFALVLDNVDLLMDNEDFYEMVVENGELGAKLLRHILLTNRIANSALGMHSSLTNLQDIWRNQIAAENSSPVG
ncbi:hypothetical protein ACJ73_05889 [Blastomyces percursus]|uniref:BTB domain-containing protein n=1 Tax=Blastomyces percursus TaxID=1658174 RepID=A0A1J9R422_9EURO|nr:hypothetical protein ACJ73_05889 [Blastomyces percursus]